METNCLKCRCISVPFGDCYECCVGRIFHYANIENLIVIFGIPNSLAEKLNLLSTHHGNITLTDYKRSLSQDECEIVDNIFSNISDNPVAAKWIQIDLKEMFEADLVNVP